MNHNTLNAKGLRVLAAVVTMSAAVMLTACESSSIGIIGGADGPTAVYVDGKQTVERSLDIYTSDDLLSNKTNEFEFNINDWKKEQELRSVYYESETDIGNDKWMVSVSDGKVMVSEYTGSSSNFRLDVPGGWFIGEDRGEFGGKLEFFDSGKNDYYTVLECNPHAMFSVNGSIYLFERLVHLGIVKGALYRLEKSNGIWKAGNKVDIGGTPEAFAVENNTVYLAVNNFAESNLSSKR